MSLLKWIQIFCINNYEKECNERIIVNIYTVDNPGWRVEINLHNTKYIDKSICELSVDNSDDDWIFIRLKNTNFDAASDKNKLVYILSFFREWVYNNTFDGTTFSVNYDKRDLLYWLQNDWFCSLDFGWDGMEYHGVKIIMKSDKTWHVEIELLDTYLEDKEFNSVNLNISVDNWVDIKVVNNIFKGCGDINKLEFIIEKFKEWAEQFKD